LACRCEPVRLCRGRAVACKSYLRTKTRPEPVVPVPVVIVVVMDATIMPADNNMRPVKTGARCMHAGGLYGDMDLTLDGLLRCGQQIHLQLFVLCQRAMLMRSSVR
jgi:hypothetical protein